MSEIRNICLALIASLMAFTPGAMALDSYSPQSAIDKEQDEYLKYQASYAKKAEVRLLVSGDSPTHLEEVVRQFFRLDHETISLRSISIVGSPWNPVANVTSQTQGEHSHNYTRLRKMFEEHKVDAPQVINSAEVLAAKNVSHSPVWLVTYQGKEYVYEGLNSPRSLFTSTGEFLAKPEIHRKSRYRFKSSRKLSSLMKNPNTGGIPKHLAQTTIAIPAYRFQVTESTLANDQSHYDNLPNCESNKVRYSEIFMEDRQFDGLDITVYKFGDQQQQQNVQESSNISIPFFAGHLHNPNRSEFDRTQGVIRMLGIQCLPTRVRKVAENGSQKLLYLEGQAAFK